MTSVTPAENRPGWILPTIIFSQFAGTSLWFAGNAVFGDLQRAWALPAAALGYVTSAIQFGFIAGTLVFAVLAVSDRWSPRIVFFVCSLLGATANLVVYVADGYVALLAMRFLTGFFLAGIYPVGMKIATGWYRSDLGNALGFLVGALVLGTALPHLIKGLGQTLPWETVLLAVSTLAACGGALMLLLVPDGPHLAQGAKFNPKALAVVFRSRSFRASAFGYFGHMWELYAFWAFVPFVLAVHLNQQGDSAGINVSFWAFVVIAAGSVGCAGGGLISLRAGSAPVAFAQLASSGLCCALSPLLFHASTPVFLAFLVFWGIVVVGDSPQLSALNAKNAPREWVGSALTIGNSIGFAVTIVSIQLLNYCAGLVDAAFLFLLLTPGPILGLIALRPLLRPAPA